MLSRLTSEIGSRPLGLARIIVGSAALLRSIVAWQTLSALNEPDVLRAPYADWLPDPSPPLAIGILIAWVVSGVLFIIGWRVAISGSVLFLTIALNLSLDQQTYSNHLYLMAWLVLLLTLARAGSGISIRRTDSPVVFWPVLLIMLQLSIVYGFSAVTKLNESFLSGEVLAGHLRAGLATFPEALRTPRFLSVMAALAVFTELFLAIFMWRRRFRPAAFILGLGLHLAITLLMADTLELLIFSLEMLALYPLFLSRERLQLIWDDGCGSCRNWVRRFQRFDVLRSLEPVAASTPESPVAVSDAQRSMYLVHGDETAQGFRAVTLTLEHLVPTLWVAPILRFPGIRSLGQRWYQWQARRRSCPAGVPSSNTLEAPRR